MKTLIAASVSALVLAAAGQAAAAPHFTPTGWYKGTYTCTIAHAPKTKLFVTLSAHTARAAVREYPYYGKTEYKTLIRIGGGSFTSVNFRGQSGYLSLRRGQQGVLRGTGRIGTTLMLLTCVKG
jgi:hypothetical protein